MSSVSQRSFAAGEVSPAIYGRTDIERAGVAVKAMRNFTVMRSGGAQSRAGTRYIGTVSTSPRNAVKIVPWYLSTTQNYLLELGMYTDARADLSYLRVWKDGALVTVTGSAWVISTVYAAGAIVSRSGTNYWCRVAHTSGASTEPALGGSWATTWSVLVGTTLEIPLPYSELQLNQLQVADVAGSTRYFAHDGLTLRQLTYVSANVWSFIPTVFASADPLTAPTGMTITGDAGSSAADDTRYRVTSLNGLLESPVSATVQWSRRPAPSVSSLGGGYSPITVSWTAVAGATGYRVYRAFKSSAFTLVRTMDASATSFRDLGEPAVSTTSSDAVTLSNFDTSTTYAGVVAAFQQRLFLGGQIANPTVVYASRTAAYTNFSVRSPMRDDDALSWATVASTLNRVRHICEISGMLVLFTEIGEASVTGDTDEILRPNEANPRMQTFNGAARYPQPLSLNDSLLYVQARGGIVRDLLTNGRALNGSDLTTLSAHLFRGRTVVSWAYQQTPHSVVWAVLDNGAMLSLTYVREEQIVAWARHDTNGGTFLSVAVVPEANVDVPYVLVSRSGVRMLERLSDRNATSELLRLHVDSAMTSASAGWGLAIGGDSPVNSTTFSPNGANFNALRLEETGGTSVHSGSYAILAGRFSRTRWEFSAYLQSSQRSQLLLMVSFDEGNFFDITCNTATGSITVTSSGANASALYTVTTATLTTNGGGYDLVVRIDPSPAYTDTDYSPKSYRATLGLLVGGASVYAGTAGFGMTVNISVNRIVIVEPNRFTGLNHLDGKSVSVLSDGVVLSNAMSARTIYSGGILVITAADVALLSAAGVPGTNWVVGLPITCDLETLDIDTANGRSLKESGQVVSRLGIWVEESRSLWAGPDQPAADLTVTGLARVTVDNASQVPLAITYGSGYIEGNLLGRFSKGGRVFLRHVDPTPLTVHAVIPMGKF